MSASAEHAAEVLQATLAGISTKDLADELAKREGVKEHICNENEAYVIQISRGYIYHDHGPAHILAVKTDG
jgi:hypothetical protein